MELIELTDATYAEACELARRDTAIVASGFRVKGDQLSALIRLLPASEGRRTASKIDLAGSQIDGDCQLADLTFAGPANFSETTFVGRAVFRDTRFQGETSFSGARFHQGACFERAHFDTSIEHGSVCSDGIPARRRPAGALGNDLRRGSRLRGLNR